MKKSPLNFFLKVFFVCASSGVIPKRISLCAERDRGMCGFGTGTNARTAKLIKA